MHQVPVKQVQREPHPFASAAHLNSFIGRTVAFVGKVDRIEEGGVLYMKTHHGKL